ncbi:MAG: preprotein translocase subunit SecE [Sphaerochaetaceae bacterium]|nr:preprotein translocase subunit SecE [Sphaerochaetaceae bacterium]
MKKLIKYLKESVLEMKKVAWPSKGTIVSYTKIVLITTIVFAVVLGLVDYVLLKGVYLVF